MPNVNRTIVWHFPTLTDARCFLDGFRAAAEQLETPGSDPWRIGLEPDPSMTLRTRHAVWFEWGNDDQPVLPVSMVGTLPPKKVTTFLQRTNLKLEV